MYLYELNSKIPVGYPQLVLPSQRGPEFYSATEKIHIYPNFFISESDEAGYSHESRDDRQMITWLISSSMTTCLTLTCYPNLFTRVPYTFGYSKFPLRFPVSVYEIVVKMWRQIYSRIRARPSKISPNCVGTLNGFTHVDWKTELIFGASFDFQCSRTKKLIQKHVTAPTCFIVPRTVLY